MKLARIAAALLVLSVCGAGIWYAVSGLRRQVAGRTDHGRSAAREGSEAAELAPAVMPEALVDRVNVAPGGDARGAQAGERGLVVLRGGGEPAAGAKVSWTPVGERLLASRWDWDELDLEWWEASTRLAVADADGRVSIAPPAVDEALGSVVWIDHPRCMAWYEVLGPDAMDLPERRIVLAEGSALEVLALDAFGEPARDAVIEQRGVRLDVQGEDPTADPVPDHVAHLYRREVAVDDAGRAELPRFPGVVALTARAADGLSRPVLVDRDRSGVVTLTLRDAFEIGGTVSRPTSPELEGELVPRISIAALDGNVWRELGTAVASGGSWGPLRLSCEPADGYRATVQGVGLITKEVDFAAPMPGERVHLHLEVEAGLVQWYQAVDEDGAPLPGARFELWWSERGRRVGLETSAGPEGYAAAMGLRPGLVRGIATAPGRRATAIPGEVLPLQEPAVIQVQLDRGAPLRGRVLHAGAPVPDFEIAYWPTDDPELRRTRVFRDRPDGAFVLDDAPLGSVGLAAAGPGLPGSRALQVTVPETGLEHVEIELREPVQGRGSVVDAKSGAPLEQATVQPLTSGGGAPLGPAGPALAVDADGAFRARAFQAGESRLIAAAPGHASRLVTALSKGGAVDFGVIGLERSVDVRVVLEGAAAEPGAFELHVDGVDPVGFSAFAVEGNDRVGVLPALSPGSNLFVLFYPDLTQDRCHPTIAADSAVVRYPGDGAWVRVQLQDAPRRPETYFVLVEYRLDGLLHQRLAPFGADGAVSVGPLPDGAARFALRDGDTTSVSVQTSVVRGASDPVVLRYGGVELRVVALDADGDAVSGAHVRLTPAAPSGPGDLRGGVTDGEGRLTLKGLTPGDYLLQASHPDFGLRSDVEVAVSEQREDLELVLPRGTTLELHLTDDGEPLPGLACSLIDRSGASLGEAALSSPEGRVSIPRLAPGSYRLRVRGAEVWPFDGEVSVEEGGVVQEIAMRRVGGLSLRVTRAGASAARVAVGLTLDDTGEDVADWLAAGRVEGDAELVTSVSGELALRGLPRGVYRWSIEGAEGVLEVRGGRETAALVALEP